MIVALELLLIVPVLTINVAEVAAAVTVTEPGTANVELLSDKVTRAPPLGAACVRVTVQVLDELGPRLFGLQDKAEIEMAAISGTVVLAEPPL